MGVRRSDFAGSWYPGREGACRQAIEDFAEAGVPCPAAERPPVGGIVPHAGWTYSGRIACNVIRCLQEGGAADTVVLFGKHLHPGSGNSIMKEGAWATPLGDLTIDRELAEGLIATFPFRVETASHYEQDNTIELQLPLVKYFFPDAMILPAGVPPHPDSLAIGERVVELARDLGRKLVVLGSTDLTHYGDMYGFAPRGAGKEALDWVREENDRRVVDLMLHMDAAGVIRESLRSGNACCSGAAATAIAAARKLGAERGVELVYGTSYDIRPNSSFVGYVGIVFG